MENGLVFIKKYQKQEVVFTNSLKVSKGSGVRHDKIKSSIKKYEEKMKELGTLHTSYEGSSKGARSHIVYNLNEQQASFLITLLKNTDSVVQFKLNLVKEFDRMKVILNERQTLEWKETRQMGKQENRNMNDKIKEFIEYAERQGSKNFKRYYSNFAKLSNKSVGIPNGMRDTVNCKKLFFHIATMGIIEEKLHEGIAKGKHYKEIYQDCKKQIEEFDKFIPASLKLN